MGFPLTEDQKNLIQRHFEELVESYRGLTLTRGLAGLWTVEGTLAFDATYNGIKILDAFDIELRLPPDYPAGPPKVFEVGSRIPEDFHRIGDELCLDTPVGVRMKFKRNSTLLDFVTDLVIPYLYAFAFSQQHGTMPFGEYSHGGEGIYEFYREFFGVDNAVHVLGLLRVLVDSKYRKYRGRLPCPCESGRRIQECHADRLVQLKALQCYELLVSEYEAVLGSAISRKQRIPKGCLSEVLRDRLDKAADKGRDDTGKV